MPLYTNKHLLRDIAAYFLALRVIREVNQRQNRRLSRGREASQVLRQRIVRAQGRIDALEDTFTRVLGEQLADRLVRMMTVREVIDSYQTKLHEILLHLADVMRDMGRGGRDVAEAQTRTLCDLQKRRDNTITVIGKMWHSFYTDGKLSVELMLAMLPEATDAIIAGQFGKPSGGPRVAHR